MISKKTLTAKNFKCKNLTKLDNSTNSIADLNTLRIVKKNISSIVLQ